MTCSPVHPPNEGGGTVQVINLYLWAGADEDPERAINNNSAMEAVGQEIQAIGDQPLIVCGDWTALLRRCQPSDKSSLREELSTLGKQ